MMHRGLTFGFLLGCAAAAAGGSTQETVRAFRFGNRQVLANHPFAGPERQP